MTIGHSATVSGSSTDDIVIGDSANIGSASNQSVTIGNSSSVTGTGGGTAVGYNATAAAEAEAFGFQASANHTGGVAIGYQAAANQNFSLAIGIGATATGSNDGEIGTETNKINTTVHGTLNHAWRLIAGGSNYNFAFATDCAAIVTSATDTGTLTLPQVTAGSIGCSVTYIGTAAAAGALITLTPNAADGIAGTCDAINMDGTVNKGILNTKATHKIGDTITVVSSGTSGAAAWYITECSGVWARGA